MKTLAILFILLLLASPVSAEWELYAVDDGDGVTLINYNTEAKKTLQEILDNMTMVAEGVKTTQSAYHLAERENVEMPITEQIYRVLFENKSPIKAMKDLMTRKSKIEDWG